MRHRVRSRVHECLAPCPVQLPRWQTMMLTVALLSSLWPTCYTPHCAGTRVGVIRLVCWGGKRVGVVAVECTTLAHGGSAAAEQRLRCVLTVEWVSPVLEDTVMDVAPLSDAAATATTAANMSAAAAAATAAADDDDGATSNARVGTAASMSMQVHRLSSSDASHAVTVNSDIDTDDHPNVKRARRDHHDRGEGEGPSPLLALLLAHNQVELWRPGGAASERQVCGADRCILYSGRLHGSTIESLLAVVGTIFSVALVWRPFPTREGVDARAALCCFKGHQGAVFSARLDATRTTLVTSSDDRSVRVWRVPPGVLDQDSASSGAPPHTPHAPTVVVSAAEHVVYGHSSRVWDAQFVGDGLIVSVGEDAACCLWSRDEGKLVTRWLGHEGKNVWCAHSCASLDAVVTGGADGAVRVWPLSGGDDAREVATATLLPAAAAQQVSSDESAAADAVDFPRLVALLSPRSCVLCTHFGDVLLMRGLTDPEPTFDVLVRAPAPRPRYYTCLRALPGRSAVACSGALDGRLVLVSGTGAFEPLVWRAHEGPVTAVYMQRWCPGDTTDASNNDDCRDSDNNSDIDDDGRSDAAGGSGGGALSSATMCVFSCEQGLMRWWVVTTRGADAPCVDAVGCFAPDASIPASLGLVQSLLWCPEVSTLWVGDRDGTLACYAAAAPPHHPQSSRASVDSAVAVISAEKNDPSSDAPALTKVAPAAAAMKHSQPTATFRKVHGNTKSITHIAMTTPRRLITAARDGYVREFTVVMADGEGASTPHPTLSLSTKTKAAAKMDWIAELADDPGEPCHSLACARVFVRCVCVCGGGGGILRVIPTFGSTSLSLRTLCFFSQSVDLCAASDCPFRRWRERVLSDGCGWL
jgi:WD40 repeat protein